MTGELSPRLLAQLRTSAERHPQAPGARAVLLLLNEIDRLKTIPAIPEPDANCPLTHTQLKIIAGTANGQHCTEIGRDLHLATRTIVKYRQEAMRRLGARTPAQAVAVCIVRGWLPSETVTLPKAPFNPPPVRGRKAYRERAALLRQHPGQWGTVTTYPSSQAATQSAYRLRHGAFTAFRPKGAWEAKAFTEDGVHGVHARYIGTPTTTAERAAS